jgi:4-amino-4-deoxy-L-arabinose transferase-like glycosyltransferase
MDHVSRRLMAFAAVASVAAIYLYPLTLGTPLLDPDEGLHASIAQEMVEQGNYLVPRFCGEPFRDKPILYFGAQAASLRVFGMNEAAVRLPGVLFSLLGCFTTWLLAVRLFDRDVAICALLAALTLVLPVMLTQSPAHDIALVPFINLLALCFWEQHHATSARARWKWLAGGATCVALALLTKGLIGVAVIAVGIGLFAVVTRSVSWRLAGSCAMVIGVGGALASPWFLTMETASPGYLKYYFVQRHLMGFVTEAETHGEAPWYYYFAPVLGGAMPWLLYSLAAVMQLGVEEKQTQRSRATVYLACWFVGGFLFLSIANSKLMTYSLPLFPPIAILAGVALNRFFCRDLTPVIGWSVAATFRVACVVGVFGPVATLFVFDHFLAAPSGVAAYAAATLAGALIAAGLLFFERGQQRAGFAIGTLWFPVLFVALMHGPYPLFAERHSQRALAREVAAIKPLPERLVMIGEETASFMFYLSPAEREWFRAGRVVEANGRTLDNLRNLPANWVVAITDKELDRTMHATEVRRIDPDLAGYFRVVTTRLTNVANRTPQKTGGRR